jgi:signal transduction histidine kinase
MHSSGHDTSAAPTAAADDAETWRRFAYTVAHDLKVPLVTMECNLLLIQQDWNSRRTERLMADLAEVSKAVQQMKRLVVELLDLARIGRLDLLAAAHTRAAEIVDLNTIVDDVIHQAQSARPERAGIVIRLHDLGRVSGRPMQLSEMFQNLIDNAMKYGDSGATPKIEIGCEDRDGTPTYFVRDNGPGIAPADRERVFDLFVQLRPDSDGVGVGLAIVRSIVASHGGKIWIEDSPEGTGIAFCFVLKTDC